DCRAESCIDAYMAVRQQGPWTTDSNDRVDHSHDNRPNHSPSTEHLVRLSTSRIGLLRPRKRPGAGGIQIGPRQKRTNLAHKTGPKMCDGHRERIALASLGPVTFSLFESEESHELSRTCTLRNQRPPEA